ncbi:MAG: acetyl-CoA carboxylase, carboxyltransferase subunit beta [Puniceicoccales bacterium]|jgi:acetyl-CoA carboxylase carboxyl transferase subunit beta|nr:acetyl-CoA carboxylase, carboxyltransferase subunit beta [Puniceicoccales bacterium]
MSLFGKPKYSTVTVRKNDIPKDIWTKCPVTGEIVYNKTLQENWMVVPKSGYHFPLSAPERIRLLTDAGSFEEKDAQLHSSDPLKFEGPESYLNKIAQYQKKTGLMDAVICGMGRLEGYLISMAVMDFRFLGGSMGSVVGEKITRCIERGIEKKCPVIIISASGGARMYEGILSLMQMAKTSAALAKLSQAHLPFISVLTNPTMAGVMASFASLGDLILAEPGALIGFAGPRVIKDTTQQELPEGFQTAEFLLQHGLIDQIVLRSQLKSRLAIFLQVFLGGLKHSERKPS